VADGGAGGRDLQPASTVTSTTSRWRRCSGSRGSCRNTSAPRRRSTSRSGETGDLPDDLAQKLNAEIEKFKKSFNIQEESALV